MRTRRVRAQCGARNTAHVAARGAARWLGAGSGWLGVVVARVVRDAVVARVVVAASVAPAECAGIWACDPDVALALLADVGLWTGHAFGVRSRATLGFGIDSASRFRGLLPHDRNGSALMRFLMLMVATALPVSELLRYNAGGF